MGDVRLTEARAVQQKLQVVCIGLRSRNYLLALYLIDVL